MECVPAPPPPHPPAPTPSPPPSPAGGPPHAVTPRPDGAAQGGTAAPVLPADPPLGAAPHRLPTAGRALGRGLHIRPLCACQRTEEAPSARARVWGGARLCVMTQRREGAPAAPWLLVQVLEGPLLLSGGWPLASASSLITPSPYLILLCLIQHLHPSASLQ